MTQTIKTHFKITKIFNKDSFFIFTHIMRLLTLYCCLFFSSNVLALAPSTTFYKQSVVESSFQKKILREIDRSHLGQWVGMGTFKMAYQYVGDNTKIILLLKKDSAESLENIKEEIKILEKCLEAGIRTIKIYEIVRFSHKDHNHAYGLVVENIKGALNLKDLGNLDNLSYESFSKKTLEDFHNCLQILKTKKIVLGDLQFLINPEGQLFLIDPEKNLNIQKHRDFDREKGIFYFYFIVLGIFVNDIRWDSDIERFFENIVNTFFSGHDKKEFLSSWITELNLSLSTLILSPEKMEKIRYFLRDLHRINDFNSLSKPWRELFLCALKNFQKDNPKDLPQKKLSSQIDFSPFLKTVLLENKRSFHTLKDTVYPFVLILQKNFKFTKKTIHKNNLFLQKLKNLRIRTLSVSHPQNFSTCPERKALFLEREEDIFPFTKISQTKDMACHQYISENTFDDLQKFLTVLKNNTVKIDPENLNLFINKDGHIFLLPFLSETAQKYPLKYSLLSCLATSLFFIKKNKLNWEKNMKNIFRDIFQNILDKSDKTWFLHKILKLSKIFQSIVNTDFRISLKDKLVFETLKNDLQRLYDTFKNDTRSEQSTSHSCLIKFIDCQTSA